MDDLIYLDHNASTPCDPRVVEAMLPFLTERFGNPSSRAHRAGRDAFQALEEARAAVAGALGAASPTEIVLTSGATEACNLALKGAALAPGQRRRRLVTQATEHKAVLETLRRLTTRGFELTVLPVDRNGLVEPAAVEAAVTDDTALVSLMLANNETGTLQPVAAVAEIAHRHGALLHCDAAQGLGKVTVDVDDLGADLLSVSGHKFGGPKGTGALYRRRRQPLLALEPQLDGGGQEGGLRSGTPNLPGAVGMARAAELAVTDLGAAARRLADLRERLADAILGTLDGVTRNGHPARCLPNTLNLAFAGVDGQALRASLPDLAVSSGSACTTASPEPSYVLRAMGVPAALAHASLRFSVGRTNTEHEIDRAAARVVEEVERLRSMRHR